ncbi:hypothetical protein FACS1894217_02410 [Clostridia bacterium]|nr:hypothetical protein FACS1894217_02410 [Clostridia bacterium]
MKKLSILIMVLALLTGCSAAEIEDMNTDPAVSTSASANPTTDVKPVNVKMEGDITEIKLDGQSVEITEGGNYSVSGTLTDGQIIISAPKQVVNLELAGVDITSSKGSAIYAATAKTFNLILKDGTVNSLTDGATRADEQAEEENAALCSDADLTISGEGTLNITGNYKHGIKAKDTLVISGGTINIPQAVKHGIYGNDSVTVTGGNITIDVGEGKVINDGRGGLAGWGKNPTATTDDTTSDKQKGIKTDGDLTITGGTLDIKNSYEGLEGINITISGGKIDIIATDDGLNVDDRTGVLTISGGELTIDSQGDGLDSNGNINMTGGTVYVSGPTMSGNGALDHDGTFTLAGGILIAADMGGMVEAPDSSSTQPSITASFATQKAGTVISLRDSSGKILCQFAPAKQFASATFSTPDIKIGQTYSIYAGDTKLSDIEATTVVTGGSEGGMGQRPGGGRTKDGEVVPPGGGTVPVPSDKLPTRPRT